MANKATKKFQVDITSNPGTIIVTAEPVASNVPETLVLANIEQVTPVFFNYTLVEANNTGTEFKETYPYPTMTRLVIEMISGKKMDWELQNITNQATWSTGLKTGLVAAANSINALF